MKRWSLIVSICLLLLAGVIIYESVTRLSFLEFGQPGSGLLPLLLAIALAVLGLILISETNAMKDRVFILPSSAWRLLKVITILIASGLFFKPLGAPIAVGLMVALWLILLERKKVWIALTTGGFTGFGIWLVFCVCFQAQLPMGFWVR